MLCNQYNINTFSDGSAWLEKNRVTFSSLTEFEYENYEAPTYSIKYVLSGTEHYLFGNQHFAVNSGQFLLVNKDQSIDTVVRSKTQVQGLCIHLEAGMLDNIYTDLTQHDDWLLDNPFETLTVPDFQEQLYSGNENCLGAYLGILASRFDPDTTAINIDAQELYQALGLQLIRLTGNLQLELAERLTALRSGTKKELLRRLEIARKAIDAENNEWLDIDHIAREGMLSCAHFLRCFKKVYGITPYQYHLKRRMAHAAYLLKKNSMKPSELAQVCGYADLASFSKAFKKEFQLAPSHYAAG